MTRFIKKDKKAEEVEEQFLSLIFPWKKKWISSRPKVGARKSGFKKVIKSLCSGGLNGYKTRLYR